MTDESKFEESAYSQSCIATTNTNNYKHTWMRHTKVMLPTRSLENISILLEGTMTVQSPDAGALAKGSVEQG